MRPPGALPPDDPIIRLRYEDRGSIGRGGMGEVRRVYDRHLERVLAMKVLSEELVDQKSSRTRFLAEARLTAQLQHPSIVSVHDHGAFSDGRLWFTMREVRGRTLSEVIHELHRSVNQGSWPTEGEATLHRVVDAFRRLCDGVAYAHSKGVVHRDLKPSNLMVGEFGEVQVMDWGLGKRLGDAEESRESTPPNDPTLTQDGDVVGTPAYMSPEQARGIRSQIDARTDVWALGACLRKILTNRPPIEGSSAAILVSLLTGGIKPIGSVIDKDHPPLPRDLVVICERAMRLEAAERYADAGELAAELGAWLEGVRRREQALAIVEEAAKLEPEIQELRVRAAEQREEAEAMLRALPYAARAEEKYAGWELEDAAANLARAASLREVEWLQRIRSALEIVPELDEAHERLAEHYRARLLDADAHRDSDAAVRCEALLRGHDRGAHTVFLEGKGSVTLITDPPGARVTVHRYVEERRRLVTREVRSLGETPVVRAELPHGSYLLTLDLPGRPTVHYPVLIERGEHWDGVPPSGTEPLAIPIPTSDDLGDGWVYVPAGWFACGGDPKAGESLSRRRVWVDGVLAAKHVVTNQEYVDYLNRLGLAGRSDDAGRVVPRVSDGSTALFLGPDAERRYHLPLSVDDPQWHPRCPVAYVDWHGAAGYAEEMGGRLPNELEWEKLARGVDGRAYACGDHVEPSWATIMGSTTGVPGRTPVDATPIDQSPYGVFGTVGNVREWCANAWLFDGPAIDGSRLRLETWSGPTADGAAARGGAFLTVPELARAACRFAGDPAARSRVVGFRIVRSFP